MIYLQKYYNLVFEDLGDVFKKVNVVFYEYITQIGLPLDLTKKDQQKIYLHFFIKDLSSILVSYNRKVIFHINTFDCCNIQYKIIKKVKQIFGIRIWESPYSMEMFADKLINNNVEIVDDFEMWINQDLTPKSFKHIKKYLNKEGFTSLSEIHFEIIANKIAILC